MVDPSIGVADVDDLGRQVAALGEGGDHDVSMDSPQFVEAIAVSQFGHYPILHFLHYPIRDSHCGWKWTGRGSRS